MATMTTAEADTLWREMDDHRTRTADMIERLSPDQLDQPSLCEGWSIRHVAAHLTMQQQDLRALGSFIARNPRMLGHLGLNGTIHHSAMIQAQRLTVPEIVAQIRAMRGSRRHNSFVTPYDALSDLLVHSQDIAVPLGLDLPVPAEAAALAAGRVWAIQDRWMSSVYRRLPLTAYRLTATDADWARGSGPEVSGPIVALLLVLTGRKVALDRLSGEGADDLRSAAALTGRRRRAGR